MGWGVGRSSKCSSEGKGSRSLTHPPPTPVAISAPVSLQSSSLCLWGISLVFCVAESVFAVRCAQLAHQLLELRPWWGKSSHHMVRPLLGSPHDSVLPRTKGRGLEAQRGQIFQLRHTAGSWFTQGPGLEGWGGIWARTGGTPRVWPGMQ